LQPRASRRALQLRAGECERRGLGPLRTSSESIATSSGTTSPIPAASSRRNPERFPPGLEQTFDLKTKSRLPLDALIAAVGAPDGEFVDRLEPLLDVDAFLTFLTAEVLLWHWDGYAGNANNYFLYADSQSGRFHFIPWGIDTILSNVPPVGSSVLEMGILARRLYAIPETRVSLLRVSPRTPRPCFRRECDLDDIARIGRFTGSVVDPREQATVARAIDDLRAVVGAPRAATR
jgi:hypothetical protein